jgi:hypothetical protein
MALTSVHSEGAELGRFLRAHRTQTPPEHVGLTVGAGTPVPLLGMTAPAATPSQEIPHGSP